VYCRIYLEYSLHFYFTSKIVVVELTFDCIYKINEINLSIVALYYRDLTDCCENLTE
jgi:hypothetical protein